MAIANIISHSREHDTTTTLKIGKETLTHDVTIDLSGEVDTTMLSTSSLYEHLSKVRTPFLLGYPSIVVPKKNELVSNKTVFQLTPFLPNETFVGQLTNVQWQISSKEDFSTIDKDVTLTIEEVKDRDWALWAIGTSLDLTSGFYYVRARYISKPNSSPWSQPVRFNLPSYKVKVPTITVEENLLTPTFTSTEYSLTDEFSSSDTLDEISKVVWTIEEVPEGTIATSDFVNKKLSDDYITECTITYGKDDENKYKLSLPLDKLGGTVDSDYNLQTLKPNTTYLVTVKVVGTKRTTQFGKYVYKTPNVKVLAPTLQYTPNELRPILTIGELQVENGSDTIKHWAVDLYELEGDSIKKVLSTTTIEQRYTAPEDICLPGKRYQAAVCAVGNILGKSEASILNITLPRMGILAPKIQSSSVGMEPRFTLSPFATENVYDTMKGTEWVLMNHAEVVDDNLDSVSSVLKEYVKESKDTFLQIPKTDIEPNTNYKIKVRYLGHKYNSPWVELNFKTIELIVVRPTVQANNIGLTITASISDYVVVGDTDTAEKVIWNVYSVVEEDADDGTGKKEVVKEHVVINKETPWYDRNLKLTKADGITKDTKYKIVAKISGVAYSSPESDPVYVTTPNIYVTSPNITITGEADKVPKHPDIVGSEFAVSADSDEHVATTWTITKKPVEVEEVSPPEEVFKLERSEHNLTSLTLIDDVLEPATSYILSVVYHSKLYGDSAIVSKEFKTRKSFVVIPDDGSDLSVVKVGDDTNNANTKYYGSIPKENLIDNRDYQGDWDGTISYAEGQQVLYNNQLWYANKVNDLEGINTNKNRIPGATEDNGVTYWTVDDRENLPTFRWVMKELGIQVGTTDNNASKLTTGDVKKGSYAVDETGSVSKVMLKEKILYVYDKVELVNVAWNDLSRYGILKLHGRTIRIGSRLYWVRTLTEAEYKELRTFHNDRDNTSATITIDWNRKQLLIPDSDVDTYLSTGKCRVSNDLLEASDQDAKVREYGFRLVLEYIPEDNEPWKYVKAQYPELKYDKYTDTGYIGRVELPENYNIWTATGLVSGTKINYGVGFLAFYNHGRRILVNRMPITYGVSYQELLDTNLVYGKDISVASRQVVTVSNLNDSKNYIVRLLRGGKNYLDPGVLDELSGDTFTANKNIGRGSEWNELLYRVALKQPKYVDREELSGGYQIGSNWETYDDINLGVFEHKSGNGCHDFVQVDVNATEVLSRGGTRLDAIYYVDKAAARNDHGVRLVLEDDTVYGR